MALSATAVVDVGAELAISRGLDAVGVRAVAKGLGVTPMALYRHIGDADALRAAVVENLLAGFPDVASDGAWDERFRIWAREARVVLSRAPGLSRHVLLGWIDLPRVLQVLDGLVATLERDGPDGCDPVAGANALLMHVLMRAQAEESVRANGLERDLSTLRRHRHEAPSLWAHREEYRGSRLDEHFAYGLDALLAGLGDARREA